MSACTELRTCGNGSESIHSTLSLENANVQIIAQNRINRSNVAHLRFSTPIPGLKAFSLMVKRSFAKNITQYLVIQYCGDFQSIRRNRLADIIFFDM